MNYFVLDRLSTRHIYGGLYSSKIQIMKESKIMKGLLKIDDPTTNKVDVYKMRANTS